MNSASILLMKILDKIREIDYREDLPESTTATDPRECYYDGRISAFSEIHKFIQGEIKGIQ